MSTQDEQREKQFTDNDNREAQMWNKGFMPHDSISDSADLTPKSPAEATTWAKDKETVHAQEPGYNNGPVVADLKTAQRMADFEDIARNPDSRQEDRDLAMDASAKIEVMAEAEATGMNDDQKKFVEAIKGIDERHPGVLEVEVDGGQKFWKLKGGTDNGFMYLSMDGVYMINAERVTDNMSEISLKKVTDQLNLIPEGHTRFISGGVSKDPTAVYNLGFTFRGEKLNIVGNATERDWFTRGIALGDRLVADEKERGTKKMGSADVLSNI